MLRLEGICKEYAGRPVLRNLALRLPAGSLLLVTGPNGSGKSTLLRIAAGLVRPDAGTVALSHGPEGLGYLGHDSFLYPQLTALENLAFWRKLHGKPADEATLLDALDALGLAALADERAATFSRGTAQRLSLARVFLQAPALLLLDEPLSGLDSFSSGLVREGLLRLMAKGASLVWVTHDPLRDLRHAAMALLLAYGGTHRVFTPKEFPDLERALAGTGGTAQTGNFGERGAPC